MVAQWTVDLCQGWAKIGTTSAFKFAGTERWMARGEWNLETATETVSWSTRLVGGVATAYGPADVDTVRLIDPASKLRFGGYVIPVSEGVGGATLEVDANGRRWTWQGPDLWDILERRVAYPDPAKADVTTWAQSHDVRTGVASTVAAAYLNANLGPGALTERQGSVVFTDPVQGLAGEWSARLQPLSELIRRVCIDGGIGVRLSVDFNGVVTATFGAPADKSERIIVNNTADTTRLTMRHIPASTTFAIAGGQGDGVSRAFRLTDSGATGDDRREVFTDQANLSSTTELQASANVYVALGVANHSITVDLTDAANTRLDYGNKVKLGETIGLDVDGVRYPVPIMAATFDITPQRQIVRPQLGEARPDSLRGLLRDVSRLAERFDRNVT